MLNLNTKRRGVLIGSLSVLIITGSLLSVNVFAQKNTDKVTQTPIDTTIVLVNADGSPSVVKSTKPLSTEQSLALLNRNGEDNVAIPPSASNRQVNVEYVGPVAYMPEEYIIDEQWQKYNDNSDTRVAIVTGFTQYTYADAPAQVKLEYEANCKSVNKTPALSDIMVIPGK